MLCQYGTCSNVGAYSCTECGSFVCGAHVGQSLIECCDCYRKRMVALAERHNEALFARQEKEAKATKGCFTSIGGFVVAIIGVVIGYNATGNAVGGVFALLFLIPGLLVGIIGGLVWLYHLMSEE